MKPLTIVISFDVDEQVMPGSIPGWIPHLMREFCFHSAKYWSPDALFSGVKPRLVGRRINSRISHRRRSA
jgi:hypothetical protein